MVKYLWLNAASFPEVMEAETVIHYHHYHSQASTSNLASSQVEAAVEVSSYLMFLYRYLSPVYSNLDAAVVVAQVAELLPTL